MKFLNNINPNTISNTKMKNFFLIVAIAIVSLSQAQKDKTYTDINEALKNYKQVYRLDLNWKKLGTLPDSIQYMSNLTYLRVSSNELTELPDFICKLINLTELDISWNKLSALPNCIGNLKQLTKLTANSNELTSLPESFATLEKLNEINLSYNKLTILPENIGNLNQLKRLDLSSNELKILPKSTGKLKQLELLDIGFNSYLEAIPESVILLPNLQNTDALKEKRDELIQEQVYRKEQEEREKKRQEEISHFKYELTFDPNDFLNSETGEFDEENAYKKLPWEIKDIYNYLKTKKDFIYNVEYFSYKKDKVEDKALVGYKIKINSDNTIESIPYNYSKKEAIKKRGLLSDFKTTISLDSTNLSMKFMPFFLLSPFRVLEKTELIEIGKNNYECVVVEGSFMFQKMKYWMVKNQPGLIVKIVSESTYHKKTWLLKKIK